MVTGHTGLKGAWAWSWLEQMGAHVSGIAHASETDPNLAEILGLTKKPSSYVLDIRDADAVRAAVEKENPEYVLHMAAQALVRRSYRDPIDTFDTNVRGTLTILDALRTLADLKACLVVTSDKVYENNDLGRHFKEDDKLGGSDPYSASKAACEIATSSFARSYYENRQPGASSAIVATARAGNVIGGGDWSEDRIIPDIWRARQRGDEVELRHPEATRPWQHALDCVGGYLMYLEALGSGHEERVLNFGPVEQMDVTVREVVEEFQKAYGASEANGWKQQPGEHPKEAKLLAIDAGRAVETLGWKPKLNPHAAIEWTAKWYAAHDTGEDMVAYTNSQIKAYRAR